MRHINRLECEDLLKQAATSIGCTLYAAFHTPGRRGQLTILIDKTPAPSAHDCELMFDQVVHMCMPQSEMLSQHRIEIATPGLDRPLLYPEHFEASVGRMIQVQHLTESGEKRSIRGQLTGHTDDTILLTDEGDNTHIIRYTDITKSAWTITEQDIHSAGVPQ